MDWQALRLSLTLAAWTVMILLPLAIVLGRWLAYGRWRGRSLVEAIVLLPLVLPPTVLGFYLLVAFSPNGAFGSFFATVFGQPLVFSFPGILIASIIANIPFAVQPIARAFEAIPQNVREAGFVSGLTPSQTFRRIELPLAWPGIITALALVFAHTLGEFGVVLMMGGNIPGSTRTLAISIYDGVQGFRFSEAAAMAGTLVVISALAVAIVMFVSRRAGHLDIYNRAR
jgi:molybdate transport system permease protein